MGKFSGNFLQLSFLAPFFQEMDFSVMQIKLVFDEIHIKTSNIEYYDIQYSVERTSIRT